MTSRAQPDTDFDFERLYAATPDPWGFESSAYEQGKYAETLASLERDRYRCALEPGCSIGVLTEALAARCDDLLAVDLSPTAVARARQRCARFGHVAFWSGDFREQLQPGRFDLIVLSEVGYYFAASSLGRLAHALRGALQPSGELLAVHWRGESPDHALSGDEVHEILDRTPGLTRRAEARNPHYRVNSWRAA